MRWGGIRVNGGNRTLAFDDEEEDDQPADKVAGREDVAVAEVDGARDEGREEGE